jgi:hypothetical protein
VGLGASKVLQQHLLMVAGSMVHHGGPRSSIQHSTLNATNNLLFVLAGDEGFASILLFATIIL